MTRNLVGVASSSGGGPGTPGFVTNLQVQLAFIDPNYVVQATWSAPVSNGGSALTDYVVQYSSDDGSNWTTFADGTSTSASATITGLAGNQTYVFRVAAVNAIGAGPYCPKSSSVTISGVAPGAPTGVSGTRGNTQVDLTWTAPGDTGGLLLTDYAIQYSSNSGGSWTTFSDGTSTNTYATVTGLTNGTSYIFRVAAVNSIGQGNYSTASSAVIPATTPSAPTSLSSTAGDQQLTIAFTAGSNGGDAITNYKYALSTNGGSSYGAWTAFSPTDTTTPVTITGLTNGTAYHVKLRAVNTVGDGAESAAVSTNTTPRGLPISVTRTVDRFNQNRATFNATWTANGATITATSFEYDTNSNFSTALTATGTGTTDAYANVTGLNPNTLYYVRAKATNAAGTQTSTAVTFSTWGFIETVLTQSNGNRTLQTITPRGGSRVNPVIAEVVVFGGGGDAGLYGAAGGGGGYKSSSEIEVTDGSGYVSWTIGAAGNDGAGGTTTISGLSGGSFSATGGGKGSDNHPVGASSSGSSGSGTNTAQGAGATSYTVLDKTESWGYGGGGGAGGAGGNGSSSIGETATATGGAGGVGVVVFTVEGGAGGGGAAAPYGTISGAGATGTYSTYGRGARGDSGLAATAGVVRFKIYGV
jgi:hypothetical protein